MENPIPDKAFADCVSRWQRRAGRHALPWQQKGRADPYRVWVAEIMLQQTQVATVIPYYERFLARFPDVTTLAAAPPEAVMALWSGLGYYARARNLHRAAREIVTLHGGRFPRLPQDIARLPGVGRSTAAAIAVFAFGARAAILDGNVRRVLARAFGIEGPADDRAVEARLWTLAEALLPARGIRRYTQGLMDLGATVCTPRRPRCAECPLAARCVARQTGRCEVLPAPRRLRPLPQRRLHVLVLLDRGRVLLQQRPPQGLWGGLLSLPELAAEELPAGCSAVRPLPVVYHPLTHLRLEIVPLLAKVSRRDTAPDGHWLSLHQLESAPLPAPVRRILADLPHGRGPIPPARAGRGT